MFKKCDGTLMRAIRCISIFLHDHLTNGHPSRTQSPLRAHRPPGPALCRPLGEPAVPPGPDGQLPNQRGSWNSTWKMSALPCSCRMRSSWGSCNATTISLLLWKEVCFHNHIAIITNALTSNFYVAILIPKYFDKKSKRNYSFLGLQDFNLDYLSN